MPEVPLPKIESPTKIRVGLMSYAMDLRQAKGTAIYTRKLIEQLLDDERFEFTLIHYEKNDDPLYAKTKELIIPEWIYRSRFVRQLYFFWRFRHQPFDIIHWFQPRAYPGYWWAPAKHLIITIHGGGKYYYPFFSISARMFDWVIRYAHHWFDRLIVVTEQARIESAETYHIPLDRLSVTYNGGGERFVPKEKVTAFTNVQTHTPEITRPFILNISRLQPHKNIGTLISAYIHLRKTTNQKEQLVIVGWPTERYEELYEQARSSAYAKDIVFIKFVEDELLNDFYSAAEVFVFPSLSEGFGLPLVEAMSAGTPVITSSVSCMPEVLGDAGMLVAPTDVLALSKAITTLLRDPVLSQSYRERGLLRAKQFTWKKTAEATKNIYFEVMGLSSKSNNR